MFSNCYYENDEVIYLNNSSISLDKKDLKKLVELSKKNKKKNIRLCIHKNVFSNMHQMLIIHPKNYYVRPHKVSDKIETGFILSGSCKLILFNDNGTVKKEVLLGSMSQNVRPFMYIIPTNTYHTIIFYSDVIFLETTSGPFDKKKVEYAKWSPSSNDSKSELLNFIKKYNA